MAIGVIWVKDWLANHLKLGPLWTTHIWHFQPIKVRVYLIYIYCCVYIIYMYISGKVYLYGWLSISPLL